MELRSLKLTPFFKTISQHNTLKSNHLQNNLKKTFCCANRLRSNVCIFVLLKRGQETVTPKPFS